MTTDFRALCAELHAAFTTYAVDECHHDLLEHTRAALADGPATGEPVSVTGQPSDQQLLEVMPQQFHDDLATVSRMAAHGAGPDVGPGLFRVSLNTGVVDFARAVLTRWGNLAPQPPAEGEVAELVEGLRLISDGMSAIGHDSDSWFVARAAELLQRLSPLQPVPVSERLPGAEDCDAEWRCWWGTPSFFNSYVVTQSAQWRLSAPDDRFGSELFWLPAHALPLPEQEVEG